MLPALGLALALAAQSAPTLPQKHLSPKPAPDAVLATVGGSPIRGSDIEALLWDWRGYEALQDAITYRTLADEAKRKGIEVSDADVEAELARQLERVKQQLQPGQTVEQVLQEQGFPKSRLFLRIKSEQMLDRLVEASFDPKNFVKVSTILIRAKSEQATDLAEALRRAEEAYAALRNGEAWNDVLGRFSSDPGILQTGGLLGWRELSAFPPTVQQELAALAAGGVTKPAQTQNGIQIFRVETKGEKAEGAVRQELRDAYLAGTRPRFMEELRKRTGVEIRWKS
jgi:foldase protein PrsA